MTSGERTINSNCNANGSVNNNTNQDYAAQIVTLSHAGQVPLCAGHVKCQPEDFQVEEILGFNFSDEGEHIYLHIEKRTMTTLDLQQHIARYAKCHVRDVGYSGLKDKHAVTRQWFSVYLPKHEPTTAEQLRQYWQGLESIVNVDSDCPAHIHLLDIYRHNKKLRKGTHKFNRFSLCIRNLSIDNCVSDIDLESDLKNRVSRINTEGFPNYFGEQRFGYKGGNLLKAERMFSGSRRVSRNKKSLYLSAVRSFLFNLLLSKRVSDKTWLHYIKGDILMLDGSNSFFSIESERSAEDDHDRAIANIEKRLVEADIHIGGVLCGEKYSSPPTDASEIEQAIIEQYPKFQEGLVAAAVKSGRRALRVMPKNLTIALSHNAEKNNKQLTLKFDLPSGSYATMLVRELVNISDVSLKST